jgi:hypothetical protein
MYRISEHAAIDPVGAVPHRNCLLDKIDLGGDGSNNQVTEPLFFEGR